jgi:predicted PurR-regulated permease PerM
MNDNLSNILAALAQKLGTTVDYLWPLLVKQARVEAIIALTCGCVFGILLSILSVKSFRHGWKEGEEGWMLLGIVLACGAIPLLGWGISNIPSVLVPEATVIHQLIGR